MIDVGKQNLLIRFGMLVIIAIAAGSALSQTPIDNLDRIAQDHYNRRDFTKALETWMQALDQDPENERIQKKIELVYEEKYKRDVAYHNAWINYREARNKIKIDFQAADLDGAIRDFRSGKSKAEEALKNYFIAYRIDPNDEEIKELRQVMKELDKDLRLAEEKILLDLERQRKYREFIRCGRERMRSEDFEGSIECWDGVLAIVAEDKEAIEGKRRAQFALTNRLKFEKINQLMKEGGQLFAEKKYFDARAIYRQVLGLDPKNSEAKDLIGEIDEKLAEAQYLEQKRQQAEGFYLSGVKNLNENKFDLAEDDFRGVIDLMKSDYRDTKLKLASIPGLRKLYEEKLRRERIRMIENELDKGSIAFAEGKYNSAISSFEEVLRLDPENRLAQTQLSISKDAQKMEGEETVDENSPYFDIVNVMIASGRQLYDRGDYRASRQKWEEILRLFPRNKIASAYMLRVTRENKEEFIQFSTKIVNDGKDYMKIKRYRQAKEKFELVKSINPDYPNIEQLITQAREPVGRGIVDLGVTPEDLERRYNLGLNYYRKGDRENLEKALGEFKWVLAKDPGNTRAEINLNKIESILRISSGQVAEKKMQLTEEQNRLVRQYYYKGINYYTNNDFAKAIQEWRKVLAIDKYNERARNNIKKCLVLLRK